MKEIHILYDAPVLNAPEDLSTWDFEKHKNYGIEFYNNTLVPINFDVPNCNIDFHLPIAVLVKKYYPEVKVKAITLKEVEKVGSFIYPIHFKFLHHYLKNNSLQQIFEKLHPKIQQKIKDKKCVLWLNDSHEYSTYLDVLNHINKVDRAIANQVVISSCNLDNGNYIGSNIKFVEQIKNVLIKLYLSVNKPKVSIFGYRFFEEVVAMQMSTFYTDYTFERKLKSLKENRFKAIICLNNVIKKHRVAITFLLYKNGLQENFISQKVVPENFYKELKGAGWNQLINQSEFQEFENLLPIKADDIQPQQQINPWNLLPYDLIDNSFLWLVTETIFEGTGLSRCFFTEKTYKPISLFMPFVMVAQPYTLYNLKKEGYQTFSRWWDESYDLEVNEIKRMQKIIDVVKFIAQKSRTELLSIYTEMQPVLEHNYNTLKNTTAAKPFVNYMVKKVSE